MIGVPSVLRVPAFRRFWLASLASNAGSWLQIVAAGWLIFQITGSPAAVGALALVARAPALVLSGYAGRLADRHDRRHVGVLAFALQGVGSAALALLAAVDRLSPAVIYVATFAVGVGFALGLPAVLAMVGVLAGRERLSEAVALNAAGINVARLAGPALGGVVLHVAGATWCFAINAVSFAALVFVLLALPPFPPAVPGNRSRLREAVVHAWRTPAPRRLLLGIAMFAALASPVQELAPVITDEFGKGAIALGLLLGMMGGGALVGAYALTRLARHGYPNHHALPLATTVFAAMTGVIAIAPWYPLALVAIFVGGAFWIWMFIATNASLQLRSPAPLLGRILGLYQLAVLGPIAIGSQAAGALAELVGIRWALGACALGLGAWGLYSLTRRVPAIDGDAPPSEHGLREGLLAHEHRRGGSHGGRGGDRPARVGESPPR